jgi:hypothetical protein
MAKIHHQNVRVQSMVLIIVLVLIAAIICLIFGGCSSLPPIIEKLSTDPASIELDIQTMSGSVHFRRTFPTNTIH